MVRKKKSAPLNDEDIAYEDGEAGESNFATVERKIEKLKKELDQCKKERGEYLDGWQRLRADVANQKQNLDAQASRTREQNKEELAKKIVPVIDSFDMAFRDDAWAEVNKTWRMGVERIYSQLQDVLKELGAERYGEVGDMFDPHLHEAASETPVKDQKQSGTIAHVLQKGFKLNGIILRPARVIVARSQE